MTLRLVLLAAAFATGTVMAGWWALPVLGAVWGLVNRGRRRVGLEAAGAAAVSWGALLVWDAAVGPFALLAAKLSGVMGLPSVVLIAMTLLFAALAAGSAAGLIASLAHTIREA